MPAAPRLLRSHLPVLLMAACLTACSVQQTQRVDRASAMGAAERIVGITIVGGQEAIFDPPGARVWGDTLVAAIRGTPFSIPVDRVERFRIVRRKPSAIATLGGIAFAVSLPVAIVGLAFALESVTR